MALLSVKDQNGLYRDTNTNAIVNKNNMEYENYIKQRESRKLKDIKINQLEDKINSIQDDISSIKNVLLDIVKKI